jgi:hypothetical protein
MMVRPPIINRLSTTTTRPNITNLIIHRPQTLFVAILTLAPKLLTMTTPIKFLPQLMRDHFQEPISLISLQFFFQIGQHFCYIPLQFFAVRI